MILHLLPPLYCKYPVIAFLLKLFNSDDILLRNNSKQKLEDSE